MAATQRHKLQINAGVKGGSLPDLLRRRQPDAQRAVWTKVEKCVDTEYGIEHRKDGKDETINQFCREQPQLLLKHRF
ncbi:hypothetical protein FQA47_024035 [Oryzias melastigma]|uniref:Uncharacterized protein n=1 Tax=Oryzias melastigma TaxID=30732 RepID=A0A834BUZ6_ORYME|nr:hypothetical protein FQA47_024035 [Oryzias melastigma]